MNLLQEVKFLTENKFESKKEVLAKIEKCKKYLQSEEFFSTLTEEQRTLIAKAKEYQKHFDIDAVRTQFSVGVGIACGPYSHLYGTTEFCINEDGHKIFISVDFIDEVSGQLAFQVYKDRSTWPAFFKEQLREDEKILTKEELENLGECSVDYTMSDEDWLSHEYAILILAGINELSKAFFKYEESDDVETNVFKFLYVLLWLGKFLSEDVCEAIYQLL